MQRGYNGRYHIPLFLAAIGLAGLVTWCSFGSVHGYAQAPATPPTATFIGSETCEECHDTILPQLAKSPHGVAMIGAEKQGRGHLCEGCHGPGSLHAEDPSEETGQPLRKVANSDTGCFQCHDKSLSRTDWARSSHQHEGVSCATCHAGRAMVAKSAKTPDAYDHASFFTKPDIKVCQTCHTQTRGEFGMPSHHPVPEGRITCSDCHDPHRPMTQRSTREMCTKCHPQQAGPHIYQHGAISGKLTDGCLDCHRPHGAPNAKLLKLTNRGLCLQCHGDRATHFVGRNCVECHTAVHGSNTSALLFRN